MHHQHGRALRPALAAGVGLLLTSGLLAACATSPASGPAGATTARTAAGGHVYVTNQLDDTLSVINGQTNKVIATVPAGKAPEGVAAAPDHRHVYIADNGSGRVSVLDTRTNKIVATVRVGKHPTGVGLSTTAPTFTWQTAGRVRCSTPEPTGSPRPSPSVPRR